MGDNIPSLSIILPTHNSRDYLAQSLPAIHRSEAASFELIVVDDASGDGSAEIAKCYGDAVITLERNVGPAKARNIGAARSKGDILLFVDVDVKVAVDTIAKIAAYLQENPDVAAIFCSYDANPAATNFPSQFKNLFHHFVHQHANTRAATFWSGCGAIRKEIFAKAGGFPEDYASASIEDVELGYRMTASGYRIDLVKEIQVTHLKKWSFFSLVRTDIMCRAIPWARLASKRGGLPYDLNFKLNDRASAVLSFFLVLAFIFMRRLNFFIPCFFILAGTLFYLNRQLYKFFYREKGFAFTAGSVLFHWFYLFYSFLTYGIVSILLCFGLFKRKPLK